MIFGINKIPIHLIVAGSSWVSRIIVSVVQLGSIRILTTGLGIEQYAIFVLLSGLAGWFLLSDFGLGISLQNYVSEQRAKEKTYDIYIYMSGILAIGFLLILIFSLHLLTPLLSDVFLHNFQAITIEEKQKLFFLAGSLLIGTTLGGIIYKIWYATQKGYLANIFPAIASIFSYASLLYINNNMVENRLALSVLAFLGPPAFFSIGAFAFNFSILTNSKKFSFDKQILLQLMKRGSSFWFVSVLAAIILQVDYVIISQKLSATDVVAYNLVVKIFGLTFFIYSSLLLALWPVFSEKIVKKNWTIVRIYIVRYIAIGCGFMFLSTLLLIFLMPKFVQLLAPDKNIAIPIFFILLMGLYQIIRVWTDTFSTVLQSMGDLRPFWLTMPFQAFLSVSIQWILTSYIGIYGIISGLIISFLFTSVWILPRATFKHINEDRIRNEH